MTRIIERSGFVADRFAGIATPDLADYRGDDGVLLAPGDDPSVLTAHFGALRLVVVSFASSADGRGFSQARQLRDLGYRGHIRARGHVLVDQYRAAHRAGIDDIEISDAQAARNPEHQWQSVPLDQGYLSRVFEGRSA